MMARIAVLLLLAVSASAVNLQHAVPKLSSQNMASDPFATAVLAELNSHLAAGGPADELIKIIDDIRNRVDESAQADTDGWTVRSGQCDNEKTRLNNEIEAKEKVIAINEANQQKAKDAMVEFKATWDRLNSEIDDKNDQIDAKVQEIQELDDKRDYEKEVFTNRTRDTNECRQAIEDILALEGNELLSSSQGDNVSSVQAAYDYEKKSTEISQAAPSDAALLSIASKLHSESAQQLMQQALKAQGNYDELQQLLSTLLEELGKYEEELQTAETAAIALYQTLKGEAEVVLANYRQELVDLTTDRDAAKASYEAEQGKLAELERLHAILTAELADLNTELDNWTTTCARQLEEYNQRVLDRAAEHDTIDAIEALIRDRLGHLLDGAKSTKTQDDVQARLENGPAE